MTNEEIGDAMRDLINKWSMEAGAHNWDLSAEGTIDRAWPHEEPAWLVDDGHGKQAWAKAANLELVEGA